MRTEQEYQDALKKLDEQQSLAFKEGLSFTGLDEPQMEALRASTTIEISSVSWTGTVPVGGALSFQVQVSNPTDSIRTQLGITAFVGPTALAPTYPEMITWRDQAWPLVNSLLFQVEPKKVAMINMPAFPVPKTMTPGFYMLNMILWEQNLFSAPAKIWSRMHVRFQVKP